MHEVFVTPKLFQFLCTIQALRAILDLPKTEPSLDKSNPVAYRSGPMKKNPLHRAFCGVSLSGAVSAKYFRTMKKNSPAALSEMPVQAQTRAAWMYKFSIASLKSCYKLKFRSILLPENFPWIVAAESSYRTLPPDQDKVGQWVTLKTAQPLVNNTPCSRLNVFRAQDYVPRQTRVQRNQIESFDRAIHQRALVLNSFILKYFLRRRATWRG